MYIKKQLLFVCPDWYIGICIVVLPQDGGKAGQLSWAVSLPQGLAASVLAVLFMSVGNLVSSLSKYSYMLTFTLFLDV